MKLHLERVELGLRQLRLQLAIADFSITHQPMILNRVHYRQNKPKNQYLDQQSGRKNRHLKLFQNRKMVDTIGLQNLEQPHFENYNDTGRRHQYQDRFPDAGLRKGMLLRQPYRDRNRQRPDIPSDKKKQEILPPIPSRFSKKTGTQHIHDCGQDGDPGKYCDKKHKLFQ